MERSNYKGKCSQWADDMGRMSNRRKRKDKSKTEKIEVNHNSWSEVEIKTCHEV